ncbi:MAG: hypothetical protein ACK4GQ_02800 [Candidatus Hadarchaeales archaeon]
MEKKTLTYIGLVGGILGIAGVFTEWASAGALGFSMGFTGFDILVRVGASDAWPVAVSLLGGVLALLGAIGLLAAKRVLGFLLPIGGILAIAGAGYAATKIAEFAGGIGGGGIPISINIGIGIYLCIIGGVLALIGTLSLKGK